jgi:hypothetical protein
MRNVVLIMTASIDGFVVAPHGHAGGLPEPEELQRWKLDRIRRAGTHIMGRVTYQEMASVWPTATGEYAAAPGRDDVLVGDHAPPLRTTRLGHPGRRVRAAGQLMSRRMVVRPATRASSTPSPATRAAAPMNGRGDWPDTENPGPNAAEPSLVPPRVDAAV